MFIVELASGLLARSTALLSDSLDISGRAYKALSVQNQGLI
jgi:Co/Zn/Cd efflux system component